MGVGEFVLVVLEKDFAREGKRNKFLLENAGLVREAASPGWATLIKMRATNLKVPGCELSVLMHLSVSQKDAAI